MDRPRTLGLTFAGGGNRAFYQLGWMKPWAERLLPRVAAVAGCSAGACVAVVLLAEREAQTSHFWTQRRAHVTRNLDWRQVLRGRSPAPHGPIYRDTLLCALAEGGFERIRALPFPFFILCAELPRGMPVPVGTLLGAGSYTLARRIDPQRLHAQPGRRLGFRPFVFDARRCDDPEELAELVIASSATPPFTPLGRFRGKTLLDGGVIDNVPAFVTESVPEVCRNVVLLTRPYPTPLVGHQGGRYYVAPSQVVPVERWDYTRPDLVDDTIEMGRREAEMHRPALARFLAH